MMDTARSQPVAHRLRLNNVALAVESLDSMVG